ncbi:response regulator [Ramlibacter henchirensis]|uniref:Response regulator n=1 Tax=Ramlibacter henchirensis TaxID=204072 RepID=A0A4Z0BUX8_9BURK|nr:response regulator [Ramlibacter henchirensis]TFZ02522.1 response regulator [Ramlibacter henchirensis]
MCGKSHGSLESASPLRASLSGETTGLRVLLVDDNSDAVESLGILLGMYGHYVLTCTHPLDALEAAPAFEPDVCILDIGLPSISGHDLARRLQAAGLTRTSFIAVTGYGSDDVRQESASAGFSLHLTKPVDPVYLLEQLCAQHCMTAPKSSANLAP